MHSFRPCDWTCKRNSGSSLAAHSAPGVTCGAHVGMIGSLKANSM